jgi:hypothetical protein
MRSTIRCPNSGDAAFASPTVPISAIRSSSVVQGHVTSCWKTDFQIAMLQACWLGHLLDAKPLHVRDGATGKRKIVRQAGIGASLEARDREASNSVSSAPCHISVDFPCRHEPGDVVAGFRRPDKIAFADKPRLMALKSVNDALNPTPLFRPGAWLLFDIALCIFAWRRRDTPTGAFVIGICGSAAVYVMTFFTVGVSTDLRYAYWAVLAALTGIIALTQKHRKSKPFMEPKLSMAA